MFKGERKGDLVDLFKEWCWWWFFYFAANWSTSPTNLRENEPGPNFSLWSPANTTIIKRQIQLRHQHDLHHRHPRPHPHQQHHNQLVHLISWLRRESKTAPRGGRHGGKRHVGGARQAELVAKYAFGDGLGDTGGGNFGGGSIGAGPRLGCEKYFPLLSTILFGWR